MTVDPADHGMRLVRQALRGNLTTDALLKSALADAAAYRRSWRDMIPACPDCAHDDDGHLVMACAPHGAEDARAEQYARALAILRGDRTLRPADEPGPPGVAPTVADSLATNRCQDSGGSGPGLDRLPLPAPPTGGQL